MNWQDVPCRIWPGATRNGYGERGISIGGHHRTIYVHREAWEQAHGPIPPGLKVCHRCDTPPCFEVRHLFLGTNAENMADAKAKGRTRNHGGLRGAENPSARLTPVQVYLIRFRYRLGGVSQAELGRRFGIGQTTVSDIVRGATWAAA